MAEVTIDRTGLSSKAQLPYPLVRNPFRHPARWSINMLQTILAMVVLGYLGKQIAIGAYYLIFELNPHMTHWWHAAIPNSTIRHHVRDVGEGYFAGLGFVFAAYNAYKKVPPPTKVDQWEMDHNVPNRHDNKPLSGWRFTYGMLLSPFYALPGALVLSGVVFLIYQLGGDVNAFVTSTTEGSSHASITSKLLGVATKRWDIQLIGLGAAYFWGRRVPKANFYDLQLWFAQRMVSYDKPDRPNDHWYYLPMLRARANELRDHGITEAVPFGFGFKFAAVITGLVALTCMATGIYVTLRFGA